MKHLSHTASTTAAEYPLRQLSRGPKNANRVFCAEGSGPDPYGNLVDSTYDASVEDNPFRFSTKFWNAEIGLYDYGYRHYAPATGRWISEDSIGEDGGANLYGSIINDPIDLVDPLGTSVHTTPISGAPLTKGYTWGNPPPADVTMNVRIDPLCVNEGCCRLSFEDIHLELVMRFWSPVQGQHEDLHRLDFIGAAHDALEKYARSKQGCYTCPRAECWRGVLEREAPWFYWWDAAAATHARRDRGEPDYQNRHKFFLAVRDTAAQNLFQAIVRCEVGGGLYP